MVKMLKKIIATNSSLNKEEQSKINMLLKTCATGTVEFYSSFSGLHSGKFKY